MRPPTAVAARRRSGGEPRATDRAARRSRAAGAMRKTPAYTRHAATWTVHRDPVAQAGGGWGSSAARRQRLAGHAGPIGSRAPPRTSSPGSACKGLDARSLPALPSPTTDRLSTYLLITAIRPYAFHGRIKVCPVAVHASSSVRTSGAKSSDMKASVLAFARIIAIWRRGSGGSTRAATPPHVEYRPSPVAAPTLCGRLVPHSRPAATLAGGLPRTLPRRAAPPYPPPQPRRPIPRRSAGSTATNVPISRPPTRGKPCPGRACATTCSKKASHAARPCRRATGSSAAGMVGAGVGAGQPA